MNTTLTSRIQNVGRIDAAVRLSIGFGLIGLVLALDLDPGTSFALTMLSVPTTLFGLFRWDPIYSLLGFKTDGDYRLRA